MHFLEFVNGLRLLTLTLLVEVLGGHELFFEADGKLLLHHAYIVPQFGRLLMPAIEQRARLLFFTSSWLFLLVRLIRLFLLFWRLVYYGWPVGTLDELELVQVVVAG